MSDAIKAYAQYISEQSKSHGKFHSGEAKPITVEAEQVQESVKPLDHKGLEKVADLGHGAHEVEHPGDTRGGAELSHPYAYAHKGKAVQIKDKKTTAAHVAKAMGHSTVTKAHHAIADYHNDSV